MQPRDRWAYCRADKNTTTTSLISSTGDHKFKLIAFNFRAAQNELRGHRSIAQRKTNRISYFQFITFEFTHQLINLSTQHRAMLKRIVSRVALKREKHFTTPSHALDLSSSRVLRVNNYIEIVMRPNCATLTCRGGMSLAYRHSLRAIKATSIVYNLITERSGSDVDIGRCNETRCSSRHSPTRPIHYASNFLSLFIQRKI